ncbi:DNA-3-methyladenine glycosylase I [Tropicibacter sp. R16_0]|uniref:DNA-3-methyladenine glycosylase I n=1 Tax=Tropicibacter sp. R16_0 TaxID=2821102 RepID=UPI001ADA897A|nr:DNA-3-methyladenine glycosylase I [Tropicibacter sp. R16_0]MBO9449345.1 DNA-3-methyladenine glycosylase I [Tropicibacter sp. R16_0]
MHHFDEIFGLAAARHGGEAALNAKLTKPKPVAELTEIPDDRWLSVITKCIFQAGFNWKVIEAKWDGFEEAFDGFDLGRCAFMDDEKFDALLTDTRIVRNGTKIATVRDNAAFLLELRQEGGVGQTLGSWPSTDYIGLLAMLKSRASRLGGTTAQYAMRFAGRDSFILSQDVVARLVAEGVVDKTPTSKKALTATQEAFNTWMDQSGRSLTEISRVLAMSL